MRQALKALQNTPHSSWESMMFRKLLAPLCCLGLVATASAQAPAEKIDTAMNAKIRVEGMEHSKLMWIEHVLTDVYGPRPIGSPNYKAAADWALKTMTDFGMKNAHLEPFTWRGIGWLPGKASGFITSPVKANIKFEANPWSPSTKGTVTGQVVSLVAPVNPTEAELDAYLVAMAPKVKGGIVMVGAPPVPPVNFNEPQKRTPDSIAMAQYGPGGGRGGRGGGFGINAAIMSQLALTPQSTKADTARVAKTLDSLKTAGVIPADVTLATLAAGRGGRGGGRGGRGGGVPPAEGQLSAQQVNARITALLRDNMPALRLMYQGTGRIPGVIVAQNGAGQVYDNVTPQPPAVILRNDDAGRIYRIIQDGTPVTVEFNMQNQYFPEGKTTYNAVAEIPGTDKADEVVIMGGHLDSWTSATGATDNAIGGAIMMEAARILLTTGAKPRRTIRVALWSGEEQGLLGSNAYVQEHYGTAEAPKPDFNKLDAYWNIDDGTGKVRGASIFGPPQAADALAQYIKAFQDWGMYGATASSARTEGGTDSGAFNVAGLPGIGTRQDQIEYNSTTWHTDLDTYERIIPDDVMKNAVLSASVVLHLANRDAMLPRYAPGEMPAVPAAGGRGGGRGAGAVAGTGPVAQPHVYAAAKSLPLTVAAPGLLGTAPRDGETPLKIALGTKPAHGTVILRADGSFVYTPAAGAVGSDSFTYTVTRDGATSEPAKVTIVLK
jgi:carboxypeptidase Q